MVVDDRGEVVERKAVGAHEDEVGLLRVRGADGPEDLVVEVRRSLAWRSKADDVRLFGVFALPIRTPVHELALRVLGLELGAELVELLLGEVAAVRLAVADEPLGDLSVNIT